MLVLARKVGQKIVIHTDPPVRITVVQLDSCAVRIGIEAPTSVLVLREEVPNREAPPS